MKLQDVILIIGIILLITIGGLITFSSIEKTPMVNTLPAKDSPYSSVSCNTVSPPVFSLLNVDRNVSHRFEIIIRSSSKQIVGIESFLLSPRQYHESGFKKTDPAELRYDLTITVDGNSTYQRRVNTSIYSVQSFMYHPGNEGIVPAFLFHSGNICQKSPLMDSNGRTPRYPEGLVYYSFGAPALHPQDIGLNTSEELYSTLQRIVNSSEEELTPYFYPHGPVIGYGYDMDGAVSVQINKEWEANQSQIIEMYEIIEGRGRQNGIQSIPCKFLSMGLIRPDSTGVSGK